MSIKGDFAKLKFWSERLTSIASDEAKTELSRNLAEEALTLKTECFRTETNPYGEKWAPKVFADGSAILFRSGELRNGWTIAKADASGFRIAPSMASKDYAQFTLGTGIFGPTGQPITPKNGRFLVFTAPGMTGSIATPSGGKMFLRSVKGSRPRLMVPTKSRGLPKAWKQEFIDTTNEFVEAYLKGEI